MKRRLNDIAKHRRKEFCYYVIIALMITLFVVIAR